MKHSIIMALALALALPIGAQEPMTYGRLCGATEGMGDNNDFCALWAQNNWQGMRNALSVAIRTGRAAENRNRFYFDHKRGSKRGAFIQLRRPWMDRAAGWDVLQHTHGHGGMVWIFSRELRLTIDLSKRPSSGFDERDDAPELGFESIAMYGGFSRDDFEFERRKRRGGLLPADFVRRMVECKIDEFGYYMGVADERRDCENITEGNDYDGGRPTDRTKLPTPIFPGLSQAEYKGCDGVHTVQVRLTDPLNGADWYQLEVTQVDPDRPDWEQVTDRDFGSWCARGEPCSCAADDRLRCDDYDDAAATPVTILNGHWRLRIRYLADDWETSEWSNPLYADHSDNVCGLHD